MEPTATVSDKDPNQVAKMFDSIAPNYDLANDLMTFGMDRVWRRAVRQALRLRPDEDVLDLAAGTGTSSADLATTGARVVGGDISTGMLAVARKAHPELEFIEADATNLDLPDNSFDAVTISFGLRNVNDTQAALKEMLRVTKPGGRIVICEFSQPPFKPFALTYRWYLKNVLGRLAGLVQSNDSAYDYLAESILAWPDQAELSQLMYEAGWSQVGFRNLTGGIVALHRAVKPVENN
ncbi:bifunctional demethylmenaquinone methyltransferase/2-methoxy-6-polyprenyl-1,4-benzoquinol methylase [Boudabousia tangfeifanii]|uniref:Demethylmenaquinone methyltransferase n=2 Tax=Boudabousia tangfeifanii TaxID=1912795 RepID=A0A1D9MLI5_9ACTO|nr:bifunctional demethylmenaquinone methyltransferase/2-methoxy-6-polyprenyl-1,4-benzoquinol methylase [Boudabousia tangfeifanii]